MLRKWHDDTAALRRYLVDGGWMTRDAAIYRRTMPMAPDEPDDPLAPS